MSDDNELTFIRCPGCRSLVPAIATRCRMCGQQLSGGKDNSKEATPEASVEKKSRIRQKTLSLNEEQITEAKEVLVEKKEVSSHRENEASEKTISPVSKFLQYGRKEVIENDSVVEPEQRNIPIQDKKPLSHREPLRFGRPSAPVEAYNPIPPRVEEPVNRFDQEEEEIEEEYESGFEEEHGDEQVIDFTQDAAPLEGVKRKRKRRRKKKKHAVNPLVVTNGDQKQTFQEPTPVPDVAKIVSLAETSVSASQENYSNRNFVSSARIEEKTFTKEVEQKKEIVDTQTKQIKEGEKKVMSTTNERTDSTPKTKYEGRLIGWLVTYRNDFRGSPIEIREGRFFIGGAKLRESDLVLADDSLSVPHCLMKAETKDGIVLQDLMSEKGSFIKKQGSNSYELITVPTVISHGDWLKFGDYEVMACVVPTDARSQK